jgi:hypothetical protein
VLILSFGASTHQSFKDIERWSGCFRSVAASLPQKVWVAGPDHQRIVIAFPEFLPRRTRQHRALGKPYPELTADGMIAANPLIDISTVSAQE